MQSGFFRHFHFYLLLFPCFFSNLHYYCYLFPFLTLTNILEFNFYLNLLKDLCVLYVCTDVCGWNRNLKMISEWPECCPYFVGPIFMTWFWHGSKENYSNKQTTIQCKLARDILKVISSNNKFWEGCLGTKWSTKERKTKPYFVWNSQFLWLKPEKLALDLSVSL